MKPLLVLIQPRLGPGGALQTLRFATGGSGAAAGVGGFQWESVIVRRPRLTLDLFSPALDGKIQTGKGDLVINVDKITQADDTLLYWPGAPITIYDATDLDLATAPVEFTGFVKSASMDLDTSQLSLAFEVATDSLDRPLLFNQFTGGGGINGTPEFRGKVMPAGFGSCQNVEPLWFDPTNNVGMIDGYGNCTAITALFEGGNDFGAKVADYPDYATLVARIVDKTVAPGRWATCVAQGLIGLGAPPYKSITADATFGTNRPGAMMSRILSTHAGIAAGSIDSAAFTALDTAVNRAVHYWTPNQRTCRDMLEAIAGSCNASPIVTFQGKFSVVRAFGGANIATIDRLTRAGAPRWTKWRALDPDTPAWRMSMRAARPGVILDVDQIMYADDLIDQGVFSAAKTYRQGNLVWNQAGAQFLFTYGTPTANATLPIAPATSNVYWTQTKPAPTAGDLYYSNGQLIESLRPAEGGADVTGGHTAVAIINQGAFATDPRLPIQVFEPRPNLLYNASFKLASQGWSTFTNFQINLSDQGFYAYTTAAGNQQAVSNPIAVSAGASYVLSAEILANLPGGGTMGYDVVWYQDAGGNTPTTSGSTPGGPSASGSVATFLGRGSTIYTAPAGAVSARIRLTKTGGVAGQTGGVRRIKFEQNTGPSPFSDDATTGAKYLNGTLMDALQPAQAGADVTSSNTAAAITGQGALATRANVFWGTSGYVYRDDGSTRVTDATAITSLGTAAAFTNQGALATRGTVLIGTHLRNSADTATMTDAGIITAQGTASAIAGQGAFATVSSVSYGSSYLTGFGSLAGRSNARIGTELVRQDGVSATNDNMLVTSLGTAAGFTGQGPFATDQRSPQQIFNNQPNLVPNGSFRVQDTNHWPLRWDFQNHPPFGMGGWGGQEQTYAYMTGPQTNVHSIAYSDPFALYPNDIYCLECEMFGGHISAGRFAIDVEVYASLTDAINKAAAGQGAVINAASDTGWQKRFATISTGASVSYCRIRVYGWDNGDGVGLALTSGNTVAVRKIKLSRGGSETVFSDEATTSSDRLTTGGTNIRLGDQRNLPAIAGASARYRVSTTISATGTSAGTGTITVADGSILMGGSGIDLSFTGGTISVSGATPGTTVNYNIYIVNPNYQSGAFTFIATTDPNAVLAAQDRIWIGTMAVFFPSSGQSTGQTGSPGGGTGLRSSGGTVQP